MRSGYSSCGIPHRAPAFPGWMLALALLMFLPAAAAAAENAPPAVLDEVVAVVNNRPILASDVEDEIRLAFLDATRPGEPALSRRRALDQLISRALVEQEIRQQDEKAATPSSQQVDARIQELRRQLPACARRNCVSEAGWNALLAEHGLTPQRVRAYIRYRMEILRFIEQRFRPGIRISPQEVENYYRSELAPKYPDPSAVPPLDVVSKRIEEILLERQVSGLFDQWLTTLRAQGDVEILDPDFERTGGAPARSGK